MNETDRAILRCRAQQLRLNRMLLAGRFAAPVHLGLGHESVAVAVSAAMGPHDKLLLPHRNVHFSFARGVSLAEVSACFDSPLGSQNAAYPSHGIVYTSSILAGHLPIACGVAMALKQEGNGGVAWAAIGDGGTEEGQMWESMILARRLNLPLVIVLEDNDQSMSSGKQQRRGFHLDIRLLCRTVDFSNCVLPTTAREMATILKVPALIEFEITSLAPHHGPLRDEPEGLVIRECLDDPVWEVKMRSEDFYQIEREIMAEVGCIPL